MERLEWDQAEARRVRKHTAMMAEETKTTAVKTKAPPHPHQPNSQISLLQAARPHKAGDGKNETLCQCPEERCMRNCGATEPPPPYESDESDADCDSGNPENIANFEWWENNDSEHDSEHNDTDSQETTDEEEDEESAGPD